jgi:hypothetical protein
MSFEEVALLKLAEPFEDLRPFFGLEPGQFGKDFGFAHGGNLIGAGAGGKPVLPRCVSVVDGRRAVPARLGGAGWWRLRTSGVRD